MKKKLLANIRALFTLLALLGMVVTYRPVTAQDTPPATPSPHDIAAIYRYGYDALNAGDLEGSVKYYADDAISVALPPPPGFDAIINGKNAIRDWNVSAIEAHAHIEITDLHITGNTLTYRTLTTDDNIKSMGAGYLEFSGTAIIENGLIVAETALMDKASLDRLLAASTLQTNKAVVARFYDEVFSKGNMAVADELVDPTFDAIFTGERNFAKSADGLAKLKEGITAFRQSFPDYQIEYTDMVAEGDLVVVNITGTGTYAGGMEDLGVPKSAIGKKVIFHGTDYTRVVNGKMVEAWGTHDDLAWFQQMEMQLVPKSE